jgi:hypothetical protein
MDDLLASIWGIDPAIVGRATHNPEPIAYHGRRRTTWPNTSFDKKAIRFDPNISRLEYVPSSPVVRLAIPRKNKPRHKSQPKSQGHGRDSGASSWLPPSPPPSPPPDPTKEHFLDLDLFVADSDDAGGRGNVDAGDGESDDNEEDYNNEDDDDKDDNDDDYRSENQQSVLSLTHQVATNVKDLAVLCGAIVVYKGISLTVSPIAWMAERLVGKE